MFYFSILIHIQLFSFCQGPQSIGTRIRSETYLVPGMILSDGLFLYLYYNEKD